MIILGCLARQAAAGDLSGVIFDLEGRPIADARIEVVGSNLGTRSNKQGEFVFGDLSAEAVELHIKASGHAHKTIQVSLDADMPLQFRLMRSVLEIIDVIGLPWHASQLESATPVNVLAGDTLRDRQSSTLGDTLRHEAGVHTNYYGPGTSSPVIRGLEGPRVMVTQNGFDAGDASRVGPDHLVATEASTARQIEILRGPATLLYGSGAIGGVVNIVDDRVPQDNLTTGEWQLQHSDVADENLVSGQLTTGARNFAVHADGFWRESDDYRIPVAAEIDQTNASGGRHRLENSAYDAQGFNFGGSYLLDRGFAGLSWGRLERTYGIPGHSHGDSHGHGAGEPEVFADLEQDRIQFHSELSLDHSLWSALNLRVGYTDYIHHEIEDDAVLTTFTNTSYEGRFELFHHPLYDWRGSLNIQYRRQDFSAAGTEAFTPPSTTDNLAIALLEERHFGGVQVQLGARLEQVDVNVDQLLLEPAGHTGGGAFMSAWSVEQRFRPVSFSAGIVWDYTAGYNMGLSLSHSERAPSAAELFSWGPHIGTGSFEVGALFDLHREAGDAWHFDLNSAPVELEKSNNIDISLRKFEGDFGFVLNAFYNRMDNFYYLQETGLSATDEHGHHGDNHAHKGGLPIYVFTPHDASLYGFEGQFNWQVSSPLKLNLYTDYTRAELRDGNNLPRIPPLRVGGQLQYRLDNFSAALGMSHFFAQKRTAQMESTSPAYTLLDAKVGVHFETAGQQLTLFLHGNNLKNEEARPHTSFLRDEAPLPGRALILGIRSSF